VFDIITEHWMSGESMHEWLAKQHNGAHIVIPTPFAVKYSDTTGWLFNSSFFVLMRPRNLDTRVFPKQRG
jgi:hypothetical protein